MGGDRSPNSDAWNARDASRAVRRRRRAFLRVARAPASLRSRVGASTSPGSVEQGHLAAVAPRSSDRLAVVYIRHGMRRITLLAIAGTLVALLVGGCSSSSTGLSSCPASPDNGFGFGAGPAYLAGQSSWYAGGQAAILSVDSKYSGPLLVRASQLGGDGTLQITLAAENLDPTALAGLVLKERQHGAAVVSAVQTTEGGLELQAVPSSPLWRAWFGRLSTSGPGCFALQVDGTAFTEVIVFAVHAGPAPPG